MRLVVYSWEIDAAQGRPEICGASGEERTLQAAKRRIETAFRRLCSWRFPDTNRTAMQRCVK